MQIILSMPKHCPFSIQKIFVSVLGMQLSGYGNAPSPFGYERLFVKPRDQTKDTRQTYGKRRLLLHTLLGTRNSRILRVALVFRTWTSNLEKNALRPCAPFPALVNTGVLTRVANYRYRILPVVPCFVEQMQQAGVWLLESRQTFWKMIWLYNKKSYKALQGTRFKTNIKAREEPLRMGQDSASGLSRRYLMLLHLKGKVLASGQALRPWHCPRCDQS